MGREGRRRGNARSDEVAAYIAVLSAEMVRLARKNKLHALAYLLDLARMEAVQQSQSDPTGTGKRIA